MRTGDRVVLCSDGVSGLWTARRSVVRIGHTARTTIRGRHISWENVVDLVADIARASPVALAVFGLGLACFGLLKYGPSALDAWTRHRAQNHAERHLQTQGPAGSIVLTGGSDERPFAADAALFDELIVRLSELEGRVSTLEDPPAPITAALEDGRQRYGCPLLLRLRNKSAHLEVERLDIRVVSADGQHLAPVIHLTAGASLTLAPGQDASVPWPIEAETDVDSYDIAITWREGPNLRYARVPIWTPRPPTP